MSIGSNPSGNSGGGEFTNMKVYSAHIYNKAYWDVSEKGDNSILAWDVNSMTLETHTIFLYNIHERNLVSVRVWRG